MFFYNRILGVIIEGFCCVLRFREVYRHTELYINKTEVLLIYDNY